MYPVCSTRGITFFPPPQSFNSLWTIRTSILVLQFVLFVLPNIALSSIQGNFSQGLSSVPHETALVRDTQLKFLGGTGRPAILFNFEVLSASIRHHSLLRQRNPVLHLRLRYLFSFHRLQTIKVQHPRVTFHFLNAHTQIWIIH